jgi:hypothetical protein
MHAKHIAQRWARSGESRTAFADRPGSNFQGEPFDFLDSNRSFHEQLSDARPRI